MSLARLYFRVIGLLGADRRLAAHREQLAAAGVKTVARLDRKRSRWTGPQQSYQGTMDVRM